LQRNFKVPALPVIAILGILINTVLMYKLSDDAKKLSAAWLAIGFVVYFLYSRHHSKLNNPKN